MCSKRIIPFLYQLQCIKPPLRFIVLISSKWCKQPKLKYHTLTKTALKTMMLLLISIAFQLKISSWFTLKHEAMIYLFWSYSCNIFPNETFCFLLESWEDCNFAKKMYLWYYVTLSSSLIYQGITYQHSNSWNFWLLVKYVLNVLMNYYFIIIS